MPERQPEPHANVDIGYNKALTEVEAVLPQMLALAEKRGVSKALNKVSDYIKKEMPADFNTVVLINHIAELQTKTQTPNEQ